MRVVTFIVLLTMLGAGITGWLVRSTTELEPDRTLNGASFESDRDQTVRSVDDEPTIEPERQASLDRGSTHRDRASDGDGVVRSNGDAVGRSSARDSSSGDTARGTANRVANQARPNHTRSKDTGPPGTRHPRTPGETPADADPGVVDVAGGASVVLRIVGDGENGDLDAVTVLRLSRNTRNRIHPGTWDNTAVVTTESSSPVRLPSAHGSFIYWASAPGFSWGKIVVDHADGGERRLTLAANPATLGVRLSNLHPDSVATLRLHRDRRHGPGVERPAETESWFTGLPPGLYHARVEIGPSASNGYVLGAAEFRLEGGREQVVEISLDDPPDLDGVIPLYGELDVRGDWDRDSITLTVQPLDVPQIQGRSTLSIPRAELEGLHILEWTAGLVVPGRYRIAVEPWGLCRLVTIEDDDTGPVVIVVPEPGEVRATVIERSTGAPVVDLPQLRWTIRASPALHSCRPMYESSDGSGTFTFSAPIGELELSQLFDATWRIDRTPVVVEPGLNVVTLEAGRACGLRVRLFDGDVPVPVADLPSGITVRPAAGTVHTVVSQSSSPGGDGRIFRFSGPGAFQLTVPPILGFAPLPIETVVVEPGDLITIDLELVPAH